MLSNETGPKVGSEAWVGCWHIPKRKTQKLYLHGKYDLYLMYKRNITGHLWETYLRLIDNGSHDHLQVVSHGIIMSLSFCTTFWRIVGKISWNSFTASNRSLIVHGMITSFYSIKNSYGVSTWWIGCKSWSMSWIHDKHTLVLTHPAWRGM